MKSNHNIPQFDAEQKSDNQKKNFYFKLNIILKLSYVKLTNR